MGRCCLWQFPTTWTFASGLTPIALQGLEFRGEVRRVFYYSASYQQLESKVKNRQCYRREECSIPCNPPISNLQFPLRQSKSTNSSLMPNVQPSGTQPKPSQTIIEAPPIDQQMKEPLHHGCVRHARMCYRNGRLELANLRHHIIHLASLSLRKTSQLIVLSPQSLHLLTDVRVTATLASALSLHTNFRIFTIFLGFRSIWNGAIRSMDTSEMFVEVFLSRESLATVTLAVRVWAVELFSRTLWLS